MKTILRIAYTLVIAAELMGCVISAQTQLQAWNDIHQASLTNRELINIKVQGCVRSTILKHSTWTADQVAESCKTN